MNFELNIPKKENQGEDAPPINITATNGRWSVVAVFDGLGGSGSTPYKENEVIHTGAYIASREARDCIYQYFIESVDKEYILIDEQLIAEIKQQIKDSLQTKLNRQVFEQSKLKSALIRTFPTTISLAYVLMRGDKSEIDILWAGDSRIYLLSSSEGLIQLTKDDLKMDNDPFENIENDSPLSNMIHLNDDFVINHKKIDYEPPYFILAATDGCFGYCSTPMHFEYMLLQNLLKSNSLEEWSATIITELKVISGDDFSMSLKYIEEGESPFLEIRESYKDRLDKMDNEYISQIKEKENRILELENLKVQLKEIKKALWNQYKKTNYRYSNIQ